MEPNTTIADQNTERLLQTAYEPEPAPPAFAASLAMKMTETAKVLAQKQLPLKPADERTDSWGLRRQTPWRRIAIALGGMAACALVIFAISSRPRNDRPGDKKTDPERTEQEQPHAGPQAADADTPAPMPLAKWTDDVRDGMMPRIRPAAPPLPILKVGDKLATRAGQRKLVQLADGTRLFVNEKTEVEATAARQVSLHAGQIYLEVAAQPDSARFVVKTAGRELTATGTHFAVAADPADAKKTGLVVTQGKVAAKDALTPGPSPGGRGELEVTAGQQLAAGESAVTSAPRATHTLAWTRDLLAAAETPMVPACQHAGGELIALDPQGQEIKLSLRTYHIDVHIEDGFARTTIDQTYFNTTWDRLEGTFYFPLPADASLSRLAMYVNDGNQLKLMEGGMAERKHAADVYETIRYMRRDPALLEWLDGSTFKMRVFPLEAKQEKRIILSYTQKLPSLYGNTRYRFTGGLNMPAVREWSFNARIKSGAGMNVWSPTVPDAMILPQGGDTLVRHLANNVKPAADVTIEMQDKTAAVENDVPRFSAMLADNHQYLMLRYRPTLPSLPERQRRDWIVLFESSAGRDPLLAGTQVDVLRHLLKNAEYDDTFTLITVNSKVQDFDKNPRPATPKNAADAVKWLESTHLIGALDLEKGMQAAVKLARAAKNPHILHVGSGIPAMGQRDAGKLAGMLPVEVPYVGVGVGKRWNRAFMKAAAERTNGLFTQINPDEVIAWRAFELLSTLNTPRLLGVQVADPTSAHGEPRFLSEMAMIAQGEEICAVTRVPTSGDKGVMPGKLVLKGTLAGKPIIKEIPVGNVMGGAGYLPRIWAKLEIDRLLAADAAKHKPEIIALSKAMYVMSPFTSLLVLETDADYEKYQVDRGRKDHWAMYPCPPKMPLVYEPDGKPPVKEEKPEAKKGGKPSAGEVLATIGPMADVQYRDILVRVQETRTGSLMLGAGGELAAFRKLQGERLMELYANGAIEQRLVDQSAQELKEARAGTDEWLERAMWAQRMARKGFVTRKQAQADVERWERELGRADKLYKQGVFDKQAFDETVKDLKIAEANLDRLNLFEINPNEVGRIPARSGKDPALLRDTAPVGGDSGFRRVVPLGELDKLLLRGSDLYHDGKLSEAEQLGRKVLNLDSDNTAALMLMTASRNRRRQAAYDRDVHANEEVFIDLLKHNVAPAPVLPSPSFPVAAKTPKVLLRDVATVISDRERTGLAGLTVADASNAMIEAAGQASSLYQRPEVAYDRLFFTDLFQYAPALTTAWADVLATLDEEADLPQPKLGQIDPAARKLIEGARSSAWQSLAVPAEGPIPGYAVYFNDLGQFAYERTLVSGLGEKVICDGKTLYHLYPEIGLASKRSFSRHHYDLIEAVNPAFLPPIDELARGCDVKAIDGATVAVLPVWAAKLKKDEKYVCVHLVFAKDGRLSERRIVEMPTAKPLARQLFHADGSVEWHGPDGKLLARQSRTVTPGKTPALTPKLADLVVINLPVRTPEHVIAQAAKRDVDPFRDIGVLSDRFIAGCFMGDPLNRQSIGKLFENPKNRKLGYYVLLNAGAVHFASVKLDGAKDELAPLNPQNEHPGSALAMFLGRTQAVLTNGDGGDLPLGPLPGPKDGFIQKLSRCRDLWLASRNPPPQADLPGFRAKVIDFLQDTPSPLFAYAILDTMQRRGNVAPTERMMEIFVKRFGPISSPVGLGYVGRYEYARSLYQAGLSAEAGKEFRALSADTLKLGVLPPIDADIRSAISAKEFVGFIRKNGDDLIAAKRYGLAFRLAEQMDEFGDQALCDELLSAILAKAGDKERDGLTLVSVRVQAKRKNFAQADRLLARLLSNKEWAQVPELWRGRADIAGRLGQTAESVKCLEKALELEFADLPEVVNLERFRSDYRTILEHYRKIAEASALLDKSAPKAFLAKVIRTADRWRLVDPESPEPCKLAGKILQAAGAKELAWDYWTTPIDLHPAESQPWVELAETLQGEGDLERADRAFALGFEAEPTNPEILWKRAQNLARLGQSDAARALYRQIADGTWQDRFNATVEQARGLAGK